MMHELETRHHKDAKRAATSRKHSGMRRPHDDRRYRPNLLRGVLEDIELYAEIRESFRVIDHLGVEFESRGNLEVKPYLNGGRRLLTEED